MRANKQLVNLAGTLLVVVILVAGVALIAMPMWSQAQRIDGQTRNVQQSNSVYEVQVAQLTTVDQEALDAEAAVLRTEITIAGRFDDVFEIITAAAGGLELSIESISVGDLSPWLPPVLTAPAATSGQQAPPSDEASAEGDAAPEGPPAKSSSTVSAAQQQATITLTVGAPDPATAMSFVDALGAGPRLITPTNVSFSNGKLTVTALTFIRTED